MWLKAVIVEPGDGPGKPPKVSRSKHFRDPLMSVCISRPSEHHSSRRFPMLRSYSISTLLLLVLFPLTVRAGAITLSLPVDTKVSSAVAVAADVKVESAGKIDGASITFDKLLPETPYDVRLTLADGTIVQGVDLNWYNEEEPKADAGPLTDEDRKEMLGIISIPDFYNKHEILVYQGSHDRAVTLVQLIRDKDFYAGKGQVIWRIELYYFKNQHGGWEKISQQNKIIRRERFKTHDEFVSVAGKVRFLASLGGLKLTKDQADKTVKVETLGASK
jgi:hypothetical protein